MSIHLPQSLMLGKIIYITGGISNKASWAFISHEDNTGTLGTRIKLGLQRRRNEVKQAEWVVWEKILQDL